MDASLSIGEVARRSGIRPSAIRFYESVGLVPDPGRAGGQRRYAPAIVDRLVVIKLARELGFALEDIRSLLNGFEPATPPPERWRTLAQEKLPAIDELIRRATAMKRLLEAGLNCHCLTIEQCFLEDCSAPTPLRRRAANAAT